MANLLAKQALTFLALLLFLGLTLFLAHMNLGLLSMPVGIFIALVKAVLVGLYFMNLRFVDGIHRMFALGGLVLLGVLFMLSLADFKSRGWLEMPGDFPPYRLHFIDKKCHYSKKNWLSID